jgi:hypothetical protein
LGPRNPRKQKGTIKVAWRLNRVSNFTNMYKKQIPLRSGAERYSAL